MLDGERQCLDLQEVGVPQATIERNAEGMRRQLGVEPRAQPAKAMSMVAASLEIIEVLTDYIEGIKVD